MRGATAHWPASQLWFDNRYFRDEHGSKLVTVAVTPNGLADSPVGDRHGKMLSSNILASNSYHLMPNWDLIMISKGN